jgi:hypothetical protein
VHQGNLNRDANYFLSSEKSESLQRYMSQIYLSNGKTVSRFSCVSANSHVMKITNRPKESDTSWAPVIDNLDLEQEVQVEQQTSFMLLTAVALSFLESYGRN